MKIMPICHLSHNRRSMWYLDTLTVAFHIFRGQIKMLEHALYLFAFCFYKMSSKILCCKEFQCAMGFFLAYTIRFLIKLPTIALICVVASFIISPAESILVLKN